MAITHNESQIQWSAANTVNVASTASSTSDSYTAATTGIAYMLSLRANNVVTPVDGDTIEFRALYSVGDTDQDTAEDFDSTIHGTRLLLLDTFLENPTQATIPLPLGFSKLRLWTQNNAANNVVISARISEVRG